MCITYTYKNIHCDIRGFRSRGAEDLNLLVTGIIELLDHGYDGTTILRNVANYVAKTRRHVPEDANLQFRAFLSSVFRQLYLLVKIYRTQYTKLGRT